MKFLLCGGGTSGHVYPAIAIAEAIKVKCENADFLFVGRENGFENKAITKAGFSIKTIRISGISRSFTAKNLKAVVLALKAKQSAKKLIKEYSPDVVIGTGGYVCWPVIKAAAELNVPTAIHESNVYPGLCSRLLSKACDKVLLNYGETKKYLPSKAETEVVGNPIRTDFTKISRKKARDDLGLTKNDIFILSFGGSGGSEKMNEVITSFMEKDVSKTKCIYHLHATGNKYYKEFSARLKTKNERCKLVPYIDNMPKMLSAADIVISRSGAVTLSEISAVGKASILIPSPNVTNDHQYKNAKLLADRGACVMIEEKNLTPQLLKSKIEILLNDAELRDEIGKKAASLSKKNASESAANSILKLTVRKSN